PFAFCALWGRFFLFFCIFGHKIGAVINSIGIIVLIQLLRVFFARFFVQSVYIKMRIFGKNTSLQAPCKCDRISLS
ncbi:MAG: hypothetical protein ACOYIO_10165, partial [Eubacteriales bacterium]